MINNSIQIELCSASADVQTNYNTDCIFYLPNLNISSEHEIYISVQHASIPYTFYQINSSNNTLKYSFLNSDQNVYTINITPGNYNVNELITFLNTSFTNIVVSYNVKTNKLTFSNNTNTNFQFLNASTCLTLFGFSSYSIVSTGYSLTSTNSINLCPVSCICVLTNFKTKSFMCMKGLKNFDQSLLCTIPVNVNRNGIIIYENNNNFKSNLYTNVINAINIKLCDMFGNLLNLNGCDWEMTIQLDIINFSES